MLDIGTIRGGLFKVSVIIKNVGATAATAVQWSINLEGGAFIGKETTGTDDIPAGGEITVTSGLIIGFGATMVLYKSEPRRRYLIQQQTGSFSPTFIFFYYLC